MICLFIISSLFDFSLVQEDSQKKFHRNKDLSKIGVPVAVSDDIKQEIPEFIVKDILKGNPDAGNITIIDYKDIE